MVNIRIKRNNFVVKVAENLNQIMFLLTGDLHIAEMLIKNGAKVNKPMKSNGFTPLLTAAESGNLMSHKESQKHSPLLNSKF